MAKSSKKSSSGLSSSRHTQKKSAKASPKTKASSNIKAPAMQLMPPPPPPDLEAKGHTGFFARLFGHDKKPEEIIPDISHLPKLDLPAPPSASKPQKQAVRAELQKPAAPQDLKKQLAQERTQIDMEYRAKKEELQRYERALQEKHDAIVKAHEEHKSAHEELKVIQKKTQLGLEELKKKEQEAAKKNMVAAQTHEQARKIHQQVAMKERLLTRKELELQRKEQFLERQVKSAQREINKDMPREELKQAQEEIRKLKEENREMARKMSIAQSHATAHERRHSMILGEIERLRKELKNKEHQLQDKEITLRAKEQEIKNIHASSAFREAGKLVAEMETGKKQTREWDAKLREREALAARKEKELAAQEAALESQKRQLDRNAQEHRHNLEALKAREEKLNAEITARKMEIAQLESAARAKHAEITSTERSTRLQEKEAQRLKAQAEELVKKTIEQKSSLEKKEQALREREKELKRKEKMLFHRELTWIEREEQIKKLAGQVEDVKREIIPQIDENRKAWETAHEQWHQVVSEFREARGILDSSFSASAGMKNQHKNFTALLKEMEKKYASLQAAQSKFSGLQKKAQEIEQQGMQFRTWKAAQEAALRKREKELSNWQDHIEARREELREAEKLASKIEFLKHTHAMLRKQVAKELSRSIKQVHEHVLKIQHDDGSAQLLEPMRVTMGAQGDTDTDHSGLEETTTSSSGMREINETRKALKRSAADEGLRATRGPHDSMQVESEFDKIRLLIHEGQLVTAEKRLDGVRKMARSLPREERERLQYEMEELRTDLELATLG